MPKGIDSCGDNYAARSARYAGDDHVPYPGARGFRLPLIVPVGNGDQVRPERVDKISLHEIAHETPGPKKARGCRQDIADEVSEGEPPRSGRAEKKTEDNEKYPGHADFAIPGTRGMAVLKAISAAAYMQHILRSARSSAYFSTWKKRNSLPKSPVN